MKTKYKVGPALITWVLLGLLSILATAASSIGVAALALLIVTIYFFPALTAEERHHRQRFPIYLLNLLLGWTVAGWVASLAWAYTTDTEQQTTSSTGPT